jgi:hypothetical protein
MKHILYSQCVPRLPTTDHYSLSHFNPPLRSNPGHVMEHFIFSQCVITPANH